MTRTDRLTAAALALGGLVLTGALLRFWGANPGYADRGLILLGSAYAAWSYRPWFAAAPAWPRPGLGLPATLLGGTAFAVALFLMTQVGPRTLLLWWTGLSLLLATAGVVVARGGFARLRVVLFPLAFVLLALPIPSAVLVPLQGTLQELTARASAFALSLTGLEVVRQDYVLTLPSGVLLVEEACSGVRSLTALTAIAAFVAFWRGESPARGLLLVLLSVPVVLAVNVFRVVLSGLVQEHVGPEYIRGDYHEALGLLMVFVGLGLILAVAARFPEPPPAGPAGPPVPTPPRGARATAAVCLLVLALCGCAAWAGRGALTQTEASTPLSEIPLELGDWRGAELEVPESVAGVLSPDVAVHRRYTNNVGRDVYVWVMAWRSGSAIKGYHHPDICWGAKGFSAADAWDEPVGPGDAEQLVRATAREFHQGGDRQVVLYWNQEGGHVWTDRDEAAARKDLLTASWAGSAWVGELLGAPPARPGGRFQVVVVAPGVGPGPRRDAKALARQVAEELYRVCPQADPRPGG